jgi:glycogen debranching enzyme
MTLSRLLAEFPNLPDVWGEGALFAFSGIDGETNSASGFVATFASDAYGLLFHTPRRRYLDITLDEMGTPRIVVGDVCAVETGQGDLVVAFSAWHTLIGVLPAGASLQLRFEDGPDADRQGGVSVSADALSRDVFVLIEQAGRFALSYGQSVEQARRRAAEWLTHDLFDEARKRLAFYRGVPALESPEDDRLLKKCVSVMKVNTLAAEGAIRQVWSTPDRVPHKDMWLWDSVFHSLGMNGLRPRLAWHFLKSVLDTQGEDGMIAHQTGPSGWRSAITQPPLLAWGVWENYQALRDKACLAYALPRLERYLDWDCTYRDRNQNGLLEWFIEGNVNCRSGESGMDNSPRFDRAVLLDAVDFSAFAARDMAYMAFIAEELGEAEKARRWRRRSKAMSKKVHDYLWDEQDGFYYDRDMDGHPSRIKAVSGFFPLLLDDVPPERVDRLVQILTDPEWFNTPFPVPSVALCEPTWSTDMWRGATWVNTNYLVILGLARDGRVEEAARLAEKTIAHVRKYYERFGVLFEFFDASDSVPPSACDRKGPQVEPYDIRRKMDAIRDYHWTAALTARLLLDWPTALS